MQTLTPAMRFLPSLLKAQTATQTAPNKSND